MSFVLFITCIAVMSCVPVVESQIDCISLIWVCCPVTVAAMFNVHTQLLYDGDHWFEFHWRHVYIFNVSAQQL